MVFGFLPLPIFIALAFFSVVGILVIAWKTKKDDQKALFIGYHLLALGVISGALVKVKEESAWPGSGLWLLGLLVLLCVFLEIFAAVIGKYLRIRSKKNHNKRF